MKILDIHKCTRNHYEIWCILSMSSEHHFILLVSIYTTLDESADLKFLLS